MQNNKEVNTNTLLNLDDNELPIKQTTDVRSKQSESEESRNKENQNEDTSQQKIVLDIDILSKVLIIQSKQMKNLSTFQFQLNQKVRQFIDNYDYNDFPLLTNKHPLPEEHYTKYIKIFDQAFPSDCNSETNPYEKIQFTKYLSTIPFIHYHHSQDMSFPNESLFRCVQMICAHHILETKLTAYINSNLTFNDLSFNNDLLNLHKRKWLLIDRTHLNYFKAELIALFCNTPLPLEVISNNSYFKHFIAILPHLLLSVNKCIKNTQLFSLQRIHAPFGQEVYLKMMEETNDYNSIEQMVAIFNSIYEQFNIFGSRMLMKLFFFNYTIDEKKILAECFNTVRSFSRMEKCYKANNGKYYELKKNTQCVLIVEGSIIEENGVDYLEEFFRLKCNRGFICKVYKSSSLYLYAIGMTEHKQIICVDPDKQNDKHKEQVYNFLVNEKAKTLVVSDMTNYSVTTDKLCCVDFQELAEEAYFVFEFKQLDEYKELINGIVKYCSTTELKQFKLKQISNRVEQEDLIANSTLIMIDKINRNLSSAKIDYGEEV